jgi:hypothetical protein
MPKETAPKAAFYQVKITLRDSPLPIWRRLVVDPDVPLSRFHEVIQIAMGWWDCSSYEFSQGKCRYGTLKSIDSDPNYKDIDAYTLSSLIKKPGDKLVYDYGHTDKWLHDILFERATSRPEDEHTALALCLHGKRACPIEQSGGVRGFAELLEAVEDPLHPEHKETLAWAEDNYDPHAFDSRIVNLRLIQWSNSVHAQRHLGSVSKTPAVKSEKNAVNDKKPSAEVIFDEDDIDNLTIFNRHKHKS